MGHMESVRHLHWGEIFHSIPQLSGNNVPFLTPTVLGSDVLAQAALAGNAAHQFLVGAFDTRRASNLARSLAPSRSCVFISMQHGIPAYIAESARCLFRECLRRADYVGSQYGSNREVLKSLVRDQFRRNMHETDPEKIQAQKEVAARALFNHMYYEAGRMAHEHAEAALIKESLLGLPRPALGMTLQDEESKAFR